LKQQNVKHGFVMPLVKAILKFVFFFVLLTGFLHLQMFGTWIFCTNG